MQDSLGEPITSEESSSETLPAAISEDGNESEEEEEREKFLLQKLMQQQQQTVNEDSSAAWQPDSSSGSVAPVIGASAKPVRESVAGRYYRGRNLTWTKESPHSTSAYQKWPIRTGSGGATSRIQAALLPLREGYLCHICGEKGHHIRNCPHGNDPKRAKKIKPATGLPRSWLTRVSEDEVAALKCDVYSLPDGSFAVLKESATQEVHVPMEKKVAVVYGTSSAAVISDHLRCPLCRQLFQAPVLVSCCGATFCDSCVMQKLAASVPENTCPGCGEIANPSDFTSNNALQESVNAILSVGKENNLATVLDAARETATQSLSSAASDSLAGTATLVPPGTLRAVSHVPGVVPLGGRLAGTKRKNVSLQSPQSTSLRSNGVKRILSEKSEVISRICTSATANA